VGSVRALHGVWGGLELAMDVFIPTRLILTVSSQIFETGIDFLIVDCWWERRVFFVAIVGFLDCHRGIVRTHLYGHFTESSQSTATKAVI
jgi:hypothetical protein